LTLPSLDSELSLSGSKSIGVSDNSPSIVSIDVDFPAGEHKIGAGDVVELIVSFDREVSFREYFAALCLTDIRILQDKNSNAWPSLGYGEWLSRASNPS
jgi:hypothetical protein